MGVNIFDFLKPPLCVLSNPQTVVLATIGSQFMNDFERNSLLCRGGGWEGVDR